MDVEQNSLAEILAEYAENGSATPVELRAIGQALQVIMGEGDGE